MSQNLQQTIHEYIAGSRFAVLAITREDGVPTTRPMGSYGLVGAGELDLYFSTATDTAKVRALRKNPAVNFFFEKPGQEIANYTAVSLIGIAGEVPHDSAEFDAASKVLAARSPHFKSNYEKGALVGTSIFRVRATEARYSDYAASHSLQEWKA